MRFINHLFDWVFGGLCVVMTPFFVVAGIQSGILALGSSSWPEVPGTILTSHVVAHQGRGVSYSPEATYRYSVNSVSYESSRIWLSGFGNDQNWAERVAARYPVGASVSVFYRPSNPALAVLVPGITEHMLFYAGFILVVTTIGWWRFPGRKLLRRFRPFA